MKIPENFNKLDELKFDFNEFQFHIQVDWTYDGYIWIFPTYDRDCLWFQIDWNQNKYTVRKCKKGNGTDGDDIIYHESIPKGCVASMNTFIDLFIKETIKWCIDKKLYLA